MKIIFPLVSVVLILVLGTCNFSPPTKNVLRQDYSIKSEFARALESSEFTMEYEERIFTGDGIFNPYTNVPRHRIYSIQKGDVFYAASNEYNVLRYCTEKMVGHIKETGQPVPYCSFNPDKANGYLRGHKVPDLKVEFYETAPVITDTPPKK